MHCFTFMTWWEYLKYKLGLKQVLILLPGYPTGTRVLVFCFDAMKHVLHSTISRSTVITTDITLHIPHVHRCYCCKAMIVFANIEYIWKVYLWKLWRVFHQRKDNVKIRGRFLCFALFLFINVKYTKYLGSRKIPGTRLKSTRVRVLEYSFQP